MKKPSNPLAQPTSNALSFPPLSISSRPSAETRVPAPTARSRRSSPSSSNSMCWRITTRTRHKRQGMGNWEKKYYSNRFPHPSSINGFSNSVASLESSPASASSQVRNFAFLGIFISNFSHSSHRNHLLLVPVGKAWEMVNQC
jgi:hypothetical protein